MAADVDVRVTGSAPDDELIASTVSGETGDASGDVVAVRELGKGM